jgi:hypothetical protein
VRANVGAKFVPREESDDGTHEERTATPTPAADRRRLADGQGIFGIVRAGLNGISVRFSLRDRSTGAIREIREARDKARAHIGSGEDPLKRRRIGRPKRKPTLRPMPLPWSRNWRSAPRRTRTRVVQRPGRLCHDHPPLAVRAQRCARAIYPFGKGALTLVDTAFTGNCAIYDDAALALGGLMATRERSSPVRNEAARDGAAAYRGLRFARVVRRDAVPVQRGARQAAPVYMISPASQMRATSVTMMKSLFRAARLAPARASTTSTWVPRGRGQGVPVRLALPAEKLKQAVGPFRIASWNSYSIRCAW